MIIFEYSHQTPYEISRGGPRGGPTKIEEAQQTSELLTLFVGLVLIPMYVEPALRRV